MEEEKLYQVGLELIPGIGDVNAKNLVSYCGSASAIFQANKSKLQRIPGIGEKTINAIKSQNILSKSQDIIRTCEKQEVSILHYTDPAYPSRLKQIQDCPNLIYVKGNGDLEPVRTIGVVGTRNATTYGKEETEKVAKSCKELNATIISGLAYGIDIQAHKSGLEAGVPNIAVLAGGLDKIYPSAHKKYADQILESGLLISENPPGIKAEAHFFPARNRIIAGMSDAVIVVEAAKKGGALITANIADSYDKTVFAVPGDLHHKYSEGCNYLIRSQKANIYTGPEDIVYHLNWDVDAAEVTTSKPDFSSLNKDELDICTVLMESETGLMIDDIAWKCQININQVASILLTLEFQGIVKSLPGKKFKLI